MTAQEKIFQALTFIMDEKDANACLVYKGYNVFTHKTGWHFTRFGKTATFIGNTLPDALQWINNQEPDKP